MDWQELTKLTGGQPLVVERVRLADTGVAIEGAFELPQLAYLLAYSILLIVRFQPLAPLLAIGKCRAARQD